MLKDCAVAPKRQRQAPQKSVGGDEKTAAYISLNVEQLRVSGLSKR